MPMLAGLWALFKLSPSPRHSHTVASWGLSRGDIRPGERGAGAREEVLKIEETLCVCVCVCVRACVCACVVGGRVGG